MLERLAAWLEPDRLRVYPAMIAGMTLVFYVASQLLGPGPLDAGGEVIGADFLAFWTGGRMALAGDWAHLYDFAAQGRLQADTIGAGDIGVHPFVSPPYALALYLPFSALPWGWGLAAWTALSAAMIAASAYWLGSVLPSRPSPLWIFAFPPVLAVLEYGQATGFLLVGLTGFVLHLRKGADVRAGLALGLLAFKPQLLVPWGIWLLVGRRWGALLGLFLASVGWLAVGEAVAPGRLHAFLDAAPHVVEMLRSPDYHGWGLANLFGFWLMLADPVSPVITDLLTLLSTMGVAGLVAWRWGRRAWVPESAADDLEIAAAVSIGLVLSPHLYFYDLALLVVPLALALRARGTNPPFGGGSLLGAAGMLYVATFVGPILTRAMEAGMLAFDVRFAIVVLVPVIFLWTDALWTEADRPEEVP